MNLIFFQIKKTLLNNQKKKKSPLTTLNETKENCTQFNMSPSEIEVVRNNCTG